MTLVIDNDTHYNDVIMSAMGSQIIGVSSSTVGLAGQPSVTEFQYFVTEITVTEIFLKFRPKYWNLP